MVAEVRSLSPAAHQNTKAPLTFERNACKNYLILSWDANFCVVMESHTESVWYAALHDERQTSMLSFTFVFALAQLHCVHYTCVQTCISQCCLLLLYPSVAFTCAHQSHFASQRITVPMFADTTVQRDVQDVTSPNEPSRDSHSTRVFGVAVSGSQILTLMNPHTDP